MSEWKKQRARELECLKKESNRAKYLRKKESEMASLTNSVSLPKLTKAVNYDNWSLKTKALLGRWLKMVSMNQPTLQVGQMLN